MIAGRVSDPVLITGIVAFFFLLLALIAFARTISRREPAHERRFRVGVFIERDLDAAAKPTSPPPRVASRIDSGDVDAAKPSPDPDEPSASLEKPV